MTIDRDERPSNQLDGTVQINMDEYELYDVRKSSKYRINDFESNQLKSGSYVERLAKVKPPPLETKVELEFRCPLNQRLAFIGKKIFPAVIRKIKNWKLFSIQKGIASVANKVQNILLDSDTNSSSNVFDINVKLCLVFDRFIEIPFPITPKLTMELRNTYLEHDLPCELKHPYVKKIVVADDHERAHCPICLEDFLGEVGMGLGAELLQCGHGFHRDCVACGLRLLPVAPSAGNVVVTQLKIPIYS